MIRNTIIADNTATTTGPDVSVSPPPAAPIASGGYNLIGKTDGSSVWVASDKTGTIATPLDAKLLPLASNGGPTQTHALLVASLARDAIPTGTNGCGTTVIDDQRGIPRPQPTGGQCDIGAFELRIALAVTSGGGQSTPVLQQFPQPLTVTATSPDLGNAPVSGVSVTFTAPASGATATLSAPNPVTTSANGQASVVATANSVVGGPYTVTASTPGLPPVPFTLTNTTAPPGSITVNPNTTPQSTPVGATFGVPLGVTVKDTLGSPFPGAVVTFTAPASGASGTFAGGVNTATTDASGIATAPTFTANTTSGSYQVTATLNGLTTSFTLTNTAGSPASLTVNSGTTPQSTPVGASFTSPLAVTVKDTLGNPVPGAVVTFSAPAGGASGSFTGGVNTATTNANGVATAPTFFANNTPGSYQVIATVDGLTATFTLTNAAVPQPPSRPGAAPSGGVPSEGSRAGSAPTGSAVPPPTGR